MVNEVIELLRISMPQRTSSITPNWETDIMNTVKDSGKMPNRYEPSPSHLCVSLGSHRALCVAAPPLCPFPGVYLAEGINMCTVVSDIYLICLCSVRCTQSRCISNGALE